jgi:hypothetical protein
LSAGVPDATRALAVLPGTTRCIARRSGLTLYRARRALRELQAQGLAEWAPSWQTQFSYARRWRRKRRAQPAPPDNEVSQ